MINDGGGEEIGYSIETDYLDHSPNPIGVLAYFERSGGKTRFAGEDLFARVEVLARDYSDMFDDADLPESYHDEFAPVADMIHRSVGPETLEEIEESTEDTYAVRFFSSTTQVDDESVAVLKDSDIFTCVNPVDMQRMLNDKRLTGEFLHDYDLPTIPTTDLASAVVRGEEYTKSEIGDTGNGWIVKHVGGAGGKYVTRFESYDAMEDAVESNEDISLSGGTSWLVQPYIDHEYDFRIMLCGDTIAAVEQRRGNDDRFQTNLSQMAGSKSERAIRGLRDGHLSILGIDRHRTMRNTRTYPETLSRPVQNLSDDIIYALEPFTDDGHDNLFVGADIMMADRDALTGIPDEYLSDRYAVGDTKAIVTELNDGSGDILDRANLFTGRGENMPVLHLAHLLGDIADVPIQEPFNVSGNLESQVWRRTGMVYDSLWPSQIMALRNRDEDFFSRIKSTMYEEGGEDMGCIGEGTIDDVIDVLFHRTEPGREYQGLPDE